MYLILRNTEVLSWDLVFYSFRFQEVEIGMWTLEATSLLFYFVMIFAAMDSGCLILKFIIVFFFFLPIFWFLGEPEIHRNYKFII